MEPQQRSFDTFARMLLTYHRADLAPCAKRTEPHLYAFFTHLYADMLAHPEAYSLPSDPFVSFFAPETRTPEESSQHEELKATSLRVRKELSAYFEFLRALGRAGEAAEAGLQLPRLLFKHLANDYAQKTRNRAFLASLERSGLSFSEDDPALVSNRLYPAMPTELLRFSQACAGVKEYAEYFFRRCDLAVLEGKTTPDIGAALHMIPQPFQREAAETDRRLMQMRFKRRIFVSSFGSSYFLRYSKKSDQVVYWVRILENWQPDLRHYLYWKLKTDLTPRLFARLKEVAPDLEEQVFAGLKACIQCYPGYCMDRTPIAWNGREKVVCKNTGWNKIGYERQDYERLWTVLSAVNELI